MPPVAPHPTLPTDLQLQHVADAGAGHGIELDAHGRAHPCSVRHRCIRCRRRRRRRLTLLTAAATVTATTTTITTTTAATSFSSSSAAAAILACGWRARQMGERTFTAPAAADCQHQSNIFEVDHRSTAAATSATTDTGWRDRLYLVIYTQKRTCSLALPPTNDTLLLGHASKLAERAAHAVVGHSTRSHAVAITKKCREALCAT